MISQRVRTIQPSATLTLNAKLQDLVREGHEILNLSVGEPDFPTPQFIRDAAKAAMDAGWTRYTAVAGHIEAREAICRHVTRTRGVEVDPSMVVISSGAKQSLSQCLLSLVDPGDEVMLAVPYWVSYPELISLADGVAVKVPTDCRDGHRLTPELLAKSLTPRTTGLILNEPGNPTGTVSSPEEIANSSDRLLQLIVWTGKRDPDTALGAKGTTWHHGDALLLEQAKSKCIGVRCNPIDSESLGDIQEQIKGSTRPGEVCPRNIGESLDEKIPSPAKAVIHRHQVRVIKLIECRGNTRLRNATRIGRILALKRSHRRSERWVADGPADPPAGHRKRLRKTRDERHSLWIDAVRALVFSVVNQALVDLV